MANYNALLTCLNNAAPAGSNNAVQYNAGGGAFGAIVPTINQLIQLVDAMYSGPWFMIEVEEMLLRQYKLTQVRIRPDDQMVGHTGYLIFARAVNRSAGGTETPSTEPTDS